MKARLLISRKNELVVDRKSKALMIIRYISKKRIGKYLVTTLYSKSEVGAGWLMRKPFLKRLTRREFEEFIDTATISSIILERTASKK